MKNSRVSYAVAGLATLIMWPGCYTFTCFVRGTKILTPRGPRRIEELAVGDEVFSLDVNTRRPVVRAVAHTLRAFATEILHIAAGELLIAGVTPEHPFYDADRDEWTTAGALAKGTRLLAWLGSADVREIEVTAAHAVPTAERVEVFNLTIDGPEHNYFAEGLLVHNKDISESDPIDSDRDGYFGGDYSGPSWDCDDSDPTVNPGAVEDCSDGKNNDCDKFGEAVDPDCGGDPCPLPTRVYAMESLFFGETNRDGSLDLQNGWRQYGHDLDGITTVDSATRACNPIAGGDVVTDGDDGTDNSFGQNILPILREYFPDKPDMLSAAANEMIGAGASTYLLKIARTDEMSCDLDVTSEVYRGLSMPAPPVFEESDVWPIDPASLKDPADPSLGASLAGPGQAVEPNYWSRPEGIWEITVDINGSALVLPLRNPLITMELVENGATGGQISGVIDIDDLVAIITKFAATADPSLCDPSSSAYQTLLFRIRAVSDAYYGPATPGSDDCNGVSIGVGFTMNRAQLGEVASPVPPPPDVCSP